MESETSEVFGNTFAKDIFTPGKHRKKLSRSRKRQDHHKAGLVHAKDKPKVKTPETRTDSPVIDRAELQWLQKVNETLATVREETKDTTSSSFFRKNGIFF